jgi:galactose oxidase-like protein
MRAQWLMLAVVAAAPWYGGLASANVTPPAALQWVQVQTTAPPTGGPAPRTHHGAIYDPVGQRMLVFGGRNQNGPLDDTWSLDLKTAQWTEIKSDPRPPARFGLTAIYDAPRHRMVIFSGQKSGGFLNDVWALDLDQNRWSEIQPKTAAAPPVRYGSAAIYDDRRDRLVMFAGFTDQGRFDDTWAFDLKGEQWIALSPSGTRPVRRCLHTATYDPLGDRMIIYAGQMTGNLEDTWAFDLEKNTWTEIKNTPIPPGRFFSALVYQPENRRGVLFGGQNSKLGTLDDTWALNLGSDQWEELKPAGAVTPPARNGHTAVYDPVGRRMLIFGGQNTDMYNDVWALTNLAPLQKP